MEWRKLKNIILLMLLALNTALAILVMGPKLSDRYRAVQADREALIFLQGKGISVDESRIPDPGSLTPKVVERDRKEEERIADLLLGADSQCQTQGGGVDRYMGENGMMQFHSDGSFWAQLEPSAFPLNGNPSVAALSVLEQIGFVGEATEWEDGAVTVVQSWDGIPLFQQKATVEWDRTGVTGITGGRRLHGVPTEDYGRTTIDLATALIDFYNGLNRMGDVCSRVDEIFPGYISATALDRQMTLTPVWRVTTDTGVYQLDLVSGTLDRVG